MPVLDAPGKRGFRIRWRGIRCFQQLSIAYNAEASLFEPLSPIRPAVAGDLLEGDDVRLTVEYGLDLTPERGLDSALDVPVQELHQCSVGQVLPALSPISRGSCCKRR